MWPLALKGRLAPGVRIRFEAFGAMVYVPERDDFFALDVSHAATARQGVDRAVTFVGPASGRARTLAELGVLATDPPLRQRPHHGPGVIGSFHELPDVSEPLLVNCLVTAYCPLQCLYCYADDVMVPNQAAEDWGTLREVAAMARAVPAMVAVITGGEPLFDLKRTEFMIRTMGPEKALVLDSSGAGDLIPLLPLLKEHAVHVRISVDSVDPAVNDSIRPIRRQYLPLGASAHALAHRALDQLRDHDVPHSVQTVVSARNADLATLRALRDHLIGREIRHWVLHVTVPAGKAAGRPWIQVDQGAVRTMLADLTAETAQDVLPIDIRVTGAHQEPDAVLLIDPSGRLCLEDRAGGGKRALAEPHRTGSAEIIGEFHAQVNSRAHVRRYLNGSLVVPARADQAAEEISRP